MAVSPAEQREMQRLGRLLTDLRAAAGITQAAAAVRLKVNNRNRISYVERGRTWPDEPELRKMIKTYKGSEDDLKLALRIMREGQSVGSVWWEPYRFAMSRELQVLVDCESVATEIYATSTILIPGLLQTRAYAQELFLDEREERGSRVMDALLEVRLGRGREVFNRQPPVGFHAIFSEAALRCLVGSADVMHEQLQYLAELAQRPHVTLQVLAFDCGAPTMLVGAYTVYDYGGMRPASTHSDANDSLVFTDKEREVDKAAARYHRLSGIALSPNESLKLIEEISEGM